jgi:hypothetical protein
MAALTLVARRRRLGHLPGVRIATEGASTADERWSKMVARRFGAAVAVLAATVVVAFPGAASAKSVGGCPTGDDWNLVTVKSLGIPPDTAVGLASLDGNEDGWTCIRPLEGPGIPEGAFIFRDNTVQG